MKFIAVVQPTYQALSKRYSAYCPDIPGCIAHEATAEKALETLKNRVSNQIASREALGLASIRSGCKIAVLEFETAQDSHHDSIFRPSKTPLPVSGGVPAAFLQDLEADAGLTALTAESPVSEMH